MRVDHIRCASCRHRIKEFEPDICFKKLDGSEMYFYHTGCAHAAERILFKEGRDVWRLVYRPVFEEGAA